MKTGAVAILDILGFKGITREVQSQRILNEMKRIEKVATSENGLKISAKRGNRSITSTKTSIRFLSDTIFIASYLSKPLLPKETRDLQGMFHFHVILNLAIVVSKVIVAGLEGDFPLLYRGCVTWGEFEDSRNYIMGPAVDEAATYERLADAAVVWFSPTATAVWDDCFSERWDEFGPPGKSTKSPVRNSKKIAMPLDCLVALTCLLQLADVPLKNLPPYETYVINPMMIKPSHMDPAHLWRRQIEAFKRSEQEVMSIETAAKQQQTERLQDEFRKELKVRFEKHGSMIQRAVTQLSGLFVNDFEFILNTDGS